MAAPAHVLLLNASFDESEMYAVWLESCGYRATVASDLDSARHVARRETVDVLVVDACYGASFHDAQFEAEWTRVTDADSLALVVLSGYLPDGYFPPKDGGHKVCVFKPCLPHKLSSSVQHLLLTVPPPAGPIRETT